MTAKADEAVDREMLGWQEECYKAMSGLRHKQKVICYWALRVDLWIGAAECSLRKAFLWKAKNAFFDELTFAYETEPQGARVGRNDGFGFWRR
jgi:hypothetical protein